MSEFNFTTETTKVFLTDKEEAYVVFEDVSTDIVVMLADHQASESVLDKLKSSKDIREHICERITTISGIKVNGKGLEVKNYQRWPAEAFGLVLDAYLKALGIASAPLQDETEKN